VKEECLGEMSMVEIRQKGIINDIKKSIHEIEEK
jgi:hypothetical protein